MNREKFKKQFQKKQWQTECDMSVPYRFMTVQIGFSTPENEDDETEFSIKAWDAEELAGLFVDFCEENGYALRNTIIDSLSVVRVAPTMEKLVEMESLADAGLKNCVCSEMTDEEAERLMKYGHSLEELLEIFSDKEELKGIYVNSCLVYPDFEKIVKALECYSCADSENKAEKRRLFVDMDGTLTKFIPQDTTGALYEKGYFLNLPPQQNVIDAVKIILKKHPEIKVIVLSAYLTDSEYALDEKMQWLEKYLPELGEEHWLFVPNGKPKNGFVGKFSENDVLLDDHTPNLNKWMPGKGIKLVNNINNKGRSWKGDKVFYDEEPDVLAEKIVDIVTGNEDSLKNDLYEAAPFRVGSVVYQADCRLGRVIPRKVAAIRFNEDKGKVCFFAEIGCGDCFRYGVDVFSTAEEAEKVLKRAVSGRMLCFTAGMTGEFEVIRTDAPNELIEEQLRINHAKEEQRDVIEDVYGLLKEKGYFVELIGSHDSMHEIPDGVDEFFDWYDYYPEEKIGGEA